MTPRAREFLLEGLICAKPGATQPGDASVRYTGRDDREGHAGAASIHLRDADGPFATSHLLQRLPKVFPLEPRGVYEAAVYLVE